jgi:hypothetical protein
MIGDPAQDVSQPSVRIDHISNPSALADRAERVLQRRQGLTGVWCLECPSAHRRASLVKMTLEKAQLPEGLKKPKRPSAPGR